MTLEEALGRITDPEVKLFIETMIKNQNSYITKLEAEKKTAAAAGQPVQGNEALTTKYIQKKMREDVIESAELAIVAAYGKDVFEAVRSDYEAFLEKNMVIENTTFEYATDAFNLVYGRCWAQKDHPVHQVGKTTPNPTGTPTPSNAGTNGSQVAAVQQIVAGQPPVMNGSDSNAGQGVPGTQGTPVKSTKEAFRIFKGKVQNNGGNKFQ